jgi:multidrug efflux system membrane fusion protein
MRRLTTAAILVGLVVGAWFAFRPTPRVDVPAASQGAAPVPVLLGAAVRKPMPIEANSVGTVMVVANLEVRSRIDGRIDQVLIEDGQAVKAGEALFQLDKRQAEAQLHQAEATLAKDRAALANARRELDRVLPLAEKQFASRQSVDQLRTALDAAEAQVRADEATVESQRVQLDYTTIRSTLDGRAGTIALKTGNSVKANDTTALVTINQIDPIMVSFTVPQADFAAVRGALAAHPLAVRAEIPGDGRGPLDGKVQFIDNAIDTATGTLGIKALFANPEGRLWPGQYVDVLLTLGTEPEAVAVPSQAVQVGQQGTYLFVVENGVARYRAVQVARTVGSESVIASGVQGGEQVVVDGQLRLTDGAKVRPAAEGTS